MPDLQNMFDLDCWKKISCEAFAQIIPPLSQGYCDPIQLTEGATGEQPVWQMIFIDFSLLQKNREWTALGTCKAHTMIIFFYEVFIWLKVQQIALRKKREKV